MITREELLTKLAIECATWDEVERAADFIDHCKKVVPPIYITKEEWIKERERLLNTPDWDDAPDDATHLVLNPDGVHWWHTKEPVLTIDGWCPGVDGEGTYAGSVLAVFKGMPWDEGYIKRPRVLNFGEEYFKNIF